MKVAIFVEIQLTMKRLISFISFALCCFLFSCEKAPFLTLNTPSNITFTEQGGSQDIIFLANRNWTASSSESWCKVSPASGNAAEGNISFKVSCDPNTTYDTRFCTVTIKVEELTEIITVNQETNLGLLISPTEYNLTNKAQTIEVEVRANVKYTVDIDASCKDWIKHISTKALNLNKLIFDISANETYDDRTGRITIRQSDGALAETITVKQGQSYGLFVTTPEYNLSNEAHTLSVEVQANVEFDVKPEVGWIHYIETRGLKTSIITLNVDANSTYDQRVGKVQVKQRNGNLSGTITITQKQLDGFFLTSREYDISNEAQTLTVEVNANIEYEVKPEVDWIHYVETKGLKTSKIALTVDANDVYDKRSGTVSVKQINGNLTGVITINQDEKYGLFTDPEQVTVSGEAQTFEVELAYNVDYDVAIPNEAKNWLSFMEGTPTRGLISKTLSFSVKANETYENRIAEVQVKQKNGSVSKVIKISQETQDLYTPLSFEAYQNKNSFSIKNPLRLLIEYRKNNGDWIKSNDLNIIVSLENGDIVSLRGNNSSYAMKSTLEYLLADTYTIIRSNCYVYGNIMSLISPDNFASLSSVPDFAFMGLFDGSNINNSPNKKIILPATKVGAFSYSFMFSHSSLSKTPDLPAKLLSRNCYQSMFEGCRLLTNASRLPATELRPSCYSRMFSMCSNLIIAPELPASSLSEYCYGQMFSGCSKLDTAPELPATSLANNCYSGMFADCLTLRRTPRLPAVDLKEGCYFGMFANCTKLEEAPLLPAISLAASCYMEMFANCLSLTEAPELPAISLAPSCYSGMFFGCSNLIKAPVLPATTLEHSCYSNMFEDCISLTNVSELPAINLAPYCYSNMFSGCSSLTTAPLLPAKKLVSYCYIDMFKGCSTLSFVSASFETEPGNHTNNWLLGVSSQGTFVKSSSATWDVRGESGIPYGWKIVYGNEDP